MGFLLHLYLGVHYKLTYLYAHELILYKNWYLDYLLNY